MDFLAWPFMLMCLNGCYGPPQTLRGQVERLPESALVVAAPRAPLGDAEALRLAAEIADPAAWAERVFAAGRPDLTPSRLFDLHRRGVPLAHIDALHAREMRARDADCAGRVAEREGQLGRRNEDALRRLEQQRPFCPPGPGGYGPGWYAPAYPFGPPHFGTFWR